MLILTMFILNVMKREYYINTGCTCAAQLTETNNIARSNAYYSTSVGTKCTCTLLFENSQKSELNLRLDWNSPYGFFNSAHEVKDEYGNLDQTITGSVGRFLGVWCVCLTF